MQIIKLILHNFTQLGGIYLLVILVHYICANLYAYYCTPLTPIGFIKSILYSQLPHCIYLRNAVNVSVSMINTMWISLGTWLIFKLKKIQTYM
jgi:hypothetical protein